MTLFSFHFLCKRPLQAVYSRLSLLPKVHSLDHLLLQRIYVAQHKLAHSYSFKPQANQSKSRARPEPETKVSSIDYETKENASQKTTHPYAVLNAINSRRPRANKQL